MGVTLTVGGTRGLWPSGISLVACLWLLGSGAALAQMTPAACPPTAADGEGPFYEPNAPMRTETGRGLKVSGRVRSTRDCAPLPHARIEWWSANAGGKYTDAQRATMAADKDGAYRYETVFPSGYAFRPPHLHVKVSAKGHRTLTTQIYPERGQNEIVFDFNLVPE